MCNFEFHDCLFFQPSFTGVRFRRMTFAAVNTFCRVFTLTSVMSVSIRSTVLTYRSGVFSTVIFMMSEPLAVKTAQMVRYVYINWNDTIENVLRFWNIYSVKSQSKVFVSTKFPSFLILKRLHAVTP